MMLTRGSRSGTARRQIPPYSSFVAFESLLRRAGSEVVPPQIDKALLVEWGIAAGNESGLITTLKSLGIVDDEGRPTELYREIRLSQPRRTAALRTAAELAYPGLAVNGETVDQDQLHDYFVEERGLTGQMVDKAMRFYRQLANAIEHPGASFDIDGGKRAAAPGRPAATRQSPARAISNVAGPAAPINLVTPGQIVPDVQTRLAPVGLTLVVQVASDATEDELTDLFRKVRRAWRRSEASLEEKAE